MNGVQLARKFSRGGWDESLLINLVLFKTFKPINYGNQASLCSVSRHLKFVKMKLRLFIACSK